MKCLAHAVRIVCLVALLMGGSSIRSSVAAQQAHKRVVVAVPEVMPEFHAQDGKTTNRAATIVRFASPDKADLIVLDSANASPATLAAAIHLLQRIRAANPNPRGDGMAVLSSFATSTVDPRLTGVLTARLRELRAQPHAQTGIRGPGIGELGCGRKVELTEAEIAP
ncbi:MAG: hypothetical protein JO040_00350 [Gemmatimonadetes bacterium]|nr:hypothetical protein [Gemmatimonadota bacterium]